jgi:hypothetical protein
MWETMKLYSDRMRERNIKMAFFSASPQGGGVPIERHALIRFSSLLGLAITWQGMRFQTSGKIAIFDKISDIFPP